MKPYQILDFNFKGKGIVDIMFITLIIYRHHIREDSMALVLNWKMVMHNMNRDSLDANIRDHVQLQLNMDAITPSSCTV